MWARSAILVIVCLAITGQHVCAETAAEKSRRLVEEASRSSREFVGAKPNEEYRIGVEGQYARAIALCREAIAADPAHYEAYLCLAWAIKSDSHNNILLIPTKPSFEAFEVVNRAIGVDPSRLDAYLIRAGLIHHGVNSSLAIAAMNRKRAARLGDGLKSARDEREQWYILSEMAEWVWRAERQESFAQPFVPYVGDAFVAAIARRPEDTEIHLMWGEVELALGRLESARKLFQRVVEIAPGGDAAKQATRILASMERDCAALKEFETCLQRLVE